jgi:hypothetical protein
MNYQEDLDKLVPYLKSQSFLSMQKVGGELPIYIYPFKPECENEIMDLKDKLIIQLSQSGLDVREIDLFDEIINSVKDEGYLEWILENEDKTDEVDFFDFLQGIIDPSMMAERLRPLLTTPECQLVLMTGVGKCYPVLRSHQLLESLHPIIGRMPIILFFPGEFTRNINGGMSLSLFNKLEYNNYYRAFNLKMEVGIR